MDLSMDDTLYVYGYSLAPATLCTHFMAISSMHISQRQERV